MTLSRLGEIADQTIIGAAAPEDAFEKFVAELQTATRYMVDLAISRNIVDETDRDTLIDIVDSNIENLWGEHPPQFLVELTGVESGPNMFYFGCNLIEEFLLQQVGQEIYHEAINTAAKHLREYKESELARKESNVVRFPGPKKK